jgi:hypothetical protein
MADIEDLMRETRERLGNPSETALPNSSLQTAVNMALEEVSRLMPVYVYKQVDLQVGVEEYSVEEEVVNVTDFWMSFPQSSAEFALDLEGTLGVLGLDPEYAGMRVFHSPSLMHILEHKWEQWFYRYGYGWEWNPDSRKILVMPPPRMTGKAVYKGTMNRTLETIPQKFWKAFKDLIYAESLMVTANAYSGGGGVTSIPIGIGDVRFDTGRMEAKAEKARKEALSKFGVGGGAVIIG